jgi:hypothetical protein
MAVSYDELLRRAWPVLHEALRMRRTLTYTELAGRVGPPLNRRQVHRQFLNPLSEHCLRAGLPDLSALVVRKNSGLPGGGWWSTPRPGFDPAAAWADMLERCFAHPWAGQPDPALFAQQPPSPTTSARGARRGPAR